MRNWFHYSKYVQFYADLQVLIDNSERDILGIPICKKRIESYKKADIEKLEAQVENYQKTFSNKTKC